MGKSNKGRFSVKQPVHDEILVIDQMPFQVRIYRTETGRYLAESVFAPDDRVVVDGPSLEDVLRQCRDLLPLALASRDLCPRQGPTKLH